jgi:tRNA nucleotidyltransferase (CCA-adding enzyme)
MPFKISEKAQKIIDALNQNGFDAYIVGGCVRDSLLGLAPSDWDICTSATPEQMKRCFINWRVIETGIKHGTLTVVMESEPFEVTTYRIDGAYLDNRHPEEVVFVDSLTEDLARRDFTINAMAYNDEKELVDPFDGVKDLTSKLIRCVGDPDKRFHEDALRIIRALRFASVYQFEIAQATAASIHSNKDLLKNIAAERINAEFCKLLCGLGAADILRNYVDVLTVFIPEIMPMIGFKQENPYHGYDVWEHTIISVTSAPKDILLRWTMLLHDIAKPMCFTRDANGIGHFYGHPPKSAEIAEQIMKRLRFDNATAETVKTLILYHDVDLLPTSGAVKKLLNKVGPENAERLLSVKAADYSAQNPEYFIQRVLKLDEFRKKLNTVLKEAQCFSLADLAVDGRDLMAAGVPQGAKIGEILNTLLSRVIAEELANDKEVLLNAAKLIKDNYK